jgi:hypothetical protein
MFISANDTPFLTEAFISQDKQCVKSCVVVVRASFEVGVDGVCRPAEKQSPFVFADTHYGDAAETAVRVETDFVPVKPRCEVLLDAMAMASHGQEATTMEVALSGPSLDKRAVVIGERRWIAGFFGVKASQPEPFTSMPLAWHLAFGGTDRTASDPSSYRSDPRNPIGRGYLETRSEAASVGTLLPCVEHPRARLDHRLGRPEPIGFGPVPRCASARISYAGTYDQHWMDHILPFLPNDFDDRYFQAAPQDQQLDSLQEGASFQCLNMSPSGRFLVRLPSMAVPVAFCFDDRIEPATLTPDTLHLVPHESRIVLVGRVGVKLPRKFVRLREIRVGSHHPRKPRFQNLGEAVTALRTRR